MKFATRALYLVASVLLAGGLFGLYRIHQPESVGQAFGMLVPLLEGAWQRPENWALALCGVVAGMAGRRLRGRVRYAVDRRRVHSITTAAGPPGRTAASMREGSGPSPDTGPLEPVRLAPTPGRVERQRGLDLLRIRLEAFLRGEPDPKAFVDHLLAEAVAHGASDIHLRPADSDAAVAWRRRGQLADLLRISRARHLDIVRRLKVLAELPPYVTDQPLDGQIRLDLDGRAVAIRLATVPTAHGEKVALRLAGDARALSLDDLVPDAEDRARLASLLDRPQGLVVLTGPTGSGKTTTLYSALDHLHRTRGERVQLASIEDPIEVDLPFVHQVQVDRGRGLGFPEALRALLRQDPNVLVLGEIRDAETAKAAVQAGLSGHLILTTLHAESTLGVFPRLIDLGVEPFLAASATVACVSQRLLRRLCPHCRHPRSFDDSAREQLRQLDREPYEQLLGDGLELGDRTWTAEGCARCEYTGFVDRVAVFEILEMDAPLRRAIASGSSAALLADPTPAQRRRSYQRAALELAARGEVALEDALGLLP